MSKKDVKKPDKAVKQPEKPPADAGKDAEAEKKDAGSKGIEVELSCGEGTGKWEVVQALLAGETDNEKSMKQPVG